MFADTLLIVFISVCTALLAEGEGAASLTSELSPRGGSQARGPRRPRAGRQPCLLGDSGGRGRVHAVARLVP